MEKKYVHGYTPRESERLVDQATTLSEILHHDTVYPAGAEVLEAGCGVGAQTVILARNSPEARFTSMDLSGESLRAARERVASQGLSNVAFQQGDIFRLPFGENRFDHVFLCFVLEHLPRPADALSCLRRVLKPGGTVAVIEGDHGSAYFHPDSSCARKAIQCLVDIQSGAGGNALIGRQLYPLLDGPGRGVHEKHLHRHGRRGQGRGDPYGPRGRDGLGPRDPGPVPDHGEARHVRIYVLQGHRPEMSRSQGLRAGSVRVVATAAADTVEYLAEGSDPGRMERE
ncbi:MAG: Methyltransferase type 11 [Deltaproteobacteria bacterium]|nr:Methyltransferase type 11 [Deltaproteobacteria bacterium]